MEDKSLTRSKTHPQSFCHGCKKITDDCDDTHKSIDGGKKKTREGWAYCVVMCAQKEIDEK